MNNPRTLRDKLSLLVESDARPRTPFELLSEEMRSKGAVGLRPLSLLESFRLDLALFFHKYFAVTLCVALLLAGSSVWIAFSVLAPSSPAAVHVQTSAITPNQSLATSAPLQQVSVITIKNSSEFSSRSVMKIEEPIAVNTDISSQTSDLVSEEPPIASVEPKELPRLIPSATFIPSSVGVNRLRSSDPPLDYSGLTASVSFEQPSIPADPAHPEFAATSANDLNYQAGYRFDRYQEAGIGYSRHIYRHIYSTSEAYYITGGGFYHQTTWHDSDDPISLPGIYYTFHANNLQILGIEPFATGFASKPSAGFLWRASAGLEWNAWDNLNAVITYSREQLNSATYATPQNVHSFFSFGLSYRLLP